MPQQETSFTITVNRVLPAQPWAVMHLLARPEAFSEFLPQIKECRLVMREHFKAITSWKVEVDGIPLAWKEESLFDPRRQTITFRAIEGDLEKFEGAWTLTEHVSGGTELKIEAKITIGIPLLGDAIGGVISEKVRRFFETLVHSFEENINVQRYRRINGRPVGRVSGFGVIGHPYNFEHLVRYLKSFGPDFKIPSQEFLSKAFDLMPSYVSYDVKEFKAASGKTTRGAFIACNIIPDMLSTDLDKAVQKVIESCKVAERLGLGIVALGGFTSIAGELYGENFRRHVNVPVTTGNTLTAALAVKGVVKAANLMGVDLAKAKVTVIGGTGDIGSACARVLAGLTKEVTVTSRTPANLKRMEKAIKEVKRAKFRGSHDNNAAVRGADIVVAAAGASQSILKPDHFKPGAIVCDVGYPKNIGYSKTDRNDILIFAGGICESPCNFNTGFDIGLPSSNILYGCFAESIVLALEERYENFSWGKGHITKEKMDEIFGLAEKHGFKLAPFFWGSRLVSDDEVKAIRTAVRP